MITGVDRPVPVDLLLETEVLRFAELLHLPQVGITFALLLQHCPPPVRQQLQPLHQQLYNQVRRLQYLSQMNAALLHVAIDWLNQSLETYSRVLNTIHEGAGRGALAPAFVDFCI